VTIWRLVAKEILHRRLSFALGLMSVVLAAGASVGALTLLKAHDLRTRQILGLKEAQTQQRMAELADDMRKAMLKLGFNVVILPKSQNLGDWYADDYAANSMPEDYIRRLSEARIMTVRHLLPSLQQKVKWPETNRTIILIGTRGEAPDLTKDPKKPMVDPVPPGTMVLGYELHQSLNINVGDKLKLLGREFEVIKLHAERGSKDDITAWINLREAQELLDKKGLINAILAVECRCAWADIHKVRAEITRILPDTRVVERASKALARAEARAGIAAEAKASIAREKRNRARLRRERERLAAILIPSATVACAAWVGLLSFGNVRERRAEIGVLRALGFSSRRILVMFLSKAAVMGAAGGALGAVAGFFVARRLGAALADAPAAAATARATFDPGLAVLTVIAAAIITCLASWIPAMTAAQQDPAVVLQEE